MVKAWVKCEGCGQLIPLKDWGKNHVCGVPVKEEVDLDKLSHKEVLEYYMLHPEEIEPGMTLILKELSIFRGRVDLVGRDKTGIVCLIEVVHHSNWDRASWIRKLQKYRSHLRRVGTLVFHHDDLKVRLLLKRSGKSTEDVTNSAVFP